MAPRRDPSVYSRHYSRKTKAQLVEELKRLERHVAESSRPTAEHTKSAANLRENELLFKVIFNGTIDAIFVIDPDSERIFDANTSACRMLQYSRRELLKLSISDIHPHEMEKVRQLAQEVFSCGKARSDQLSCHTKSGGFIPVEVVASRVIIQGSPFMLVVARDVTERKQVEEALRESEQRFRDFAMNAADRFWEMDENLQFVSVTDHPDRGIALDLEQFIGRTRWQLAEADPETDEKWHRHREDHLMRRPYRDLEYATTDAHGVVLHWSVSGTPIFNDAGVFTGYRGSATDITERKRVEEALRSAKETAEFANRSKSEFLANMSHELRTPLNAINGFAEIMSNQMLGPLGTPQYIEYARDIHESGTHLLNLINDILDLSQIEVGKLELKQKEVDVAQMVAACRRIIEVRAKEAGLTLDTRLSGDLPRLWSDERAVKQIILNLLSNAVKFTPAGGKVTVHAEIEEGGCFALSVSDSGIGIDADDIPKLFKPFSQIDGSLSRKYEGTGLGLSLVKSLVEMHGGSIALESVLGNGTIITIRFPAERVLDDSTKTKGKDVRAGAA